MKKIYSASQQCKRLTRTLVFPKWAMLLLTMISLSLTTFAQQVTLTATVGAPTGTFTTLKGAFDAVNAGTHQGVIAISVNANTTETLTAVLNSSGTGAASYNYLEIRPTATVSVSGTIAGALVRLNGADNVYIDGELSGSRQLTFQNNSATNTSAVIWLSSASGADGATTNTIRNCIIIGAFGTESATTHAGIISSGSTTLGSNAESANSDNVYELNEINTANFGIRVVGPTTFETGTIIRENIIGSTISANKLLSRGLYIQNQQDFLVSANTIQGIQRTNTFGSPVGGSTIVSGIYVTGNTSGGLIEKNNISDITHLGTGGWGASGIELQATTVALTNLVISNNFISDIKTTGWTALTSFDDGSSGFCIRTGGGYKIYNNSINITGAETRVGSITSAFWVASAITTGGGQNEIINNSISNARTAAGQTHYAIYSNAAASAFSIINRNNYYVASGNVGFLGGARATISDWRTATGQDLNSVSVIPNYVSATDLHLQPNSPLDALGTPVGAVADDIDGDGRNATTPDIGADEFTPPGCVGNNAGTITASASQFCASGTATLNSTGYSFGLGMTYQWEFFNGSIWQSIPGQTSPVGGSTGPISATTSFRLRANCNAGAPGYSNVIVITVNNPAVTSTSPATRCGVGTVSLAATGSNLSWYDVPTGGLAVATGSPFVTPVLSSTTTYYVSAAQIGASASGGKFDNSGTGSSVNFGYGLIFNATSEFVILSVKMYPTSAGTANIELRNSSNAVIPGGTTVVTFTGAAPAGVVVPINLRVPVGTGYRLFLASTTTTLFRNTAGATYPYALGALGSITSNTFNNPNYYYYFYDWQIQERCEGTRTPVVATITAPPAITPTVSPATICSGNSSNLNVSSGNAGYTYQWNPGGLSGAAQTVSPDTITVYTVTATDASGGAFNGCVNVANITLTVNPTPTALTVTPATASICAGATVALTATGGLLPNQNAIQELFETFPLTQFTNFDIGSPAITAAQNTTYYAQGSSSVLITHGNNSNGGIAMSSNINLTNFATPRLTFSHIAALEASAFTNWDAGMIDYSTDGGTNWTKLPSSSYLGTGALKPQFSEAGAFIGFNVQSYPEWTTRFTAAGIDPGTGPASSLWKQEIIDLSPWAGSTTFRIRFRLRADGSDIYYGWLIDNVRISGTSQASIIWSPTTELFTNPAATIPYTGTSAAVVYAKPTINRTYTATAGSGCTRTGTSALTVVVVAPAVALVASPSTSVCTGTSVSFTATPNIAGTQYSYTFFIDPAGPAPNAPVFTSPASPIPTYTYTTSTLNDGDVVTASLLIAGASSCVSGAIVSNPVTMTINPFPSVNITGGNTVCNGAPPTVLTANASVSPGSISTYEWFIGGVSQGAPSGVNTFNATLPGTYTVVATTAAGCATTSANFVVTLPSYTITATALANGTISPSGAVSVNCGDDITFTITPNAFFSIQDVLVDGVSVGAVGTYTFTNVTGPHTIVASFFISGCPNPPTADAGPDASFCANQSYTLSGSIGGTATIGTWSGGGGTFTPNNTTLNASYTPSAAEIAAGTVTLTLTTNNPFGAPCVVSTSSVTLEIKEIPTVNITGTLGFCPSNSTTLTANASINPVGPITYAWLFNGVTSLGTAVTQTSSSGAGNYQVTATGNGCSNTANVNVVAFVAPSVTIDGSNLICTNSFTTLTADVVAGSGSISATAYQWQLGGSNLAGVNTVNYTTNVVGNYTVFLTDDNGCVSAVSPIHTLSLDNSPLNGDYTISSAAASCTNYSSFASAINDLNTRSIAGNVRFLVAAGYTETAPVGGLALGTVFLNGSVGAFTITFEKDGIGANPLITAPVGTATPASLAPDGILSIRGTDNVILRELSFTDPNATNPASMDYGIGLFKLSLNDGVQNALIENCTITLNRVNNAVAGGPMVEGSVGILVINSTATAATTLLVPTLAAGTNSNNKFYGNTIQNCNHGIALRGYVAPYPYTLMDNNNDIGGASSLTGNIIQNFGGGGSNQSMAIRAEQQRGLNVSNNTINNNTGAGINHTGTLRGIYGFGGISATVTINNNTVDLKGGANSQVIAIENQLGSNNLHTGTATSSGSTVTVPSSTGFTIGMPVTVFSGTGAFAPGTTVTGIPTGTTITVNPAPTTILAGAIIQLVNTNTVNISNNSVVTTNASATTAAVTNIINTAGANTVNINANMVQNCTLPGTGAWTGISNSQAGPVVSIIGNTLQNNTINSTGAFTGITHSQAGSTNVSMNNNIVLNNTKGTTATVDFVRVISAVNAFINGNIIEGNIVNAASANITMTSIQLGSASYTIDGNIVSNNSIANMAGAGIGTVRGINFSGTALNETVSNNQVSRLFVTGASTGQHILQGINSGSSVGATKNIFNNRIDTIYVSAAMNAIITGILSTQGATVNIYKNKVSHLVPGGNLATNIGRGIWLSTIAAASTSAIHNNMINLDLAQAFAPASNNRLTAADGLRGIDVSVGTATTLSVYYNTVRLNGGGSGTGFGSSAFSLNSTTANTTLINNIFVNTTTPGGTSPGVATAFRKSAVALTNYISTSNNNVFFAGVPSASRLLYFDGTNAYQTLATYQAAVTPRETASLDVSPSFVSTTDLHLNPSANCDVDGSGRPIAGTAFETDIDLDTRSTSAPDIGADEFVGSGGSPIWKGYNSNWTDSTNWCGSVPTSTTNVVIPSGKSFYPIITTNTPVCANINIASAGSVTITGLGKLAIYGNITNAGTFNVSDGTVEFAGSSAQTIPSGVFVSDNVKNLIINNATVNLAGALNLTNKLSFVGSNRTFATAGNLTIKSTSTNTASVTDITNNGTNSGNTITGDVTVERFVTARRAWRLLAVPTQHNFQTIKQAWQENQAANATTPAGFGIQIPSNRASWAGDGFDLYTPNGGPSVKTYNPATNNWDGIISTVNVATPTPSNGRFVEGEAYMTFVRGDRTVNTFPSAATTTVLREKGLLRTGNFGPVAVGANLFEAIGNPYASAIDFTKLTKSNLQDVYYVWDPYLGTLGGYQTFLGPGYTATPGGGSYTNGNTLIESGSAFFVRSSGLAGSVTFTEPSKADTNYLVQRQEGPQQRIRTNLYQVPAAGGNAVLLDGVLNRFDASYSDDIDGMDAYKLTNFNENIGLRRNGKSFVVESRSGIVATDTIFYELGQVRAQNYQLAFDAENLNQYGVEAFLEDVFLNTKTPVNLNGQTVLPFTVINEPGSYASGRFRLVFKLLAPVPVSFTQVKAERANQDILVSWKVENEVRIGHYDVEESADGRQFVKIGEKQATGNGGATVEYSLLDRQVINGYNYYRIRSVGIDGEVKYSEIVKVNVSNNVSAEFAVYPNPVREDGIVQVSLNNAEAGNYVISLYNSLGQVSYRKQITHGGGSSVYTIEFGKQMAHGQYNLELRLDDKEKRTFKIIY